MWWPRLSVLATAQTLPLNNATGGFSDNCYPSQQRDGCLGGWRPPCSWLLSASLTLVAFTGADWSSGGDTGVAQWAGSLLDYLNWSSVQHYFTLKSGFGRQTMALPHLINCAWVTRSSSPEACWWAGAGRGGKGGPPITAITAPYGEREAKSDSSHNLFSVCSPPIRSFHFSFSATEPTVFRNIQSFM